MNTKLHTKFITVCAALLIFMGMSAQQTHLVIPIAMGDDDAEEATLAASGDGWSVAVGDVSLGSSDLELYWDDGPQFVGVLFRDVQLPTDVEIDSAYIQFISKSDASAAIDIQISGVDSATVVSITDASFGVSSKVSTTATVDWAPEAWIKNAYPYSPVEAERTPDLTSIISEITANAGWAEGNNMMFKLTGTVDEDANRNAYSYEDEGDGSTGPHLHIYYTPKADDGIVMGGKTDKGPEANGNYYPWADDDAMWGLQFDALQDMVLLSVKVDNGTATGGDTGTEGTTYEGDRTFTVISAEDDTIGSATVNVVAGEQRLALNILVPAGTGYRLIADSHVGLWRDGTSENEAFPYLVGDIATITGDIKWTGGSVSTNQYHFFYDWEVRAAEITGVIKGGKTEKGPEANGNFYEWADDDAMWGLQFDANIDMKLLSVKVYNGTATGGDTETVGTTYEGDRTFTVISAEDDTIGAATVNVVAGEQRVALNILVPAGKGYRLISDVHVGLWRDKTSGTEYYPYAVGDIATVTGDIKWTGGSVSTTQYHFFYDWEVKASEITGVIKGGKTEKGPEADGNYYNWADDDAKWGLQFDANIDMKLLSVKVYNGFAVGGDAGDGLAYTGDRTFTVTSAEDVVIGAATVNVVDGEQRLALDIDVPAGKGYRLISDSQVGLWRDKTSENEAYPYAVGDIATLTGDIKWDGGSVTTTQYHFFYDWEVEATTIVVVELDTDALTALIASSKTAIAAVTIGDAEGEYAQATVDAANAAITAAETVLASATTQAEVDQATTDLTAAMALFVANGPNAIGSALNANFRMYPNPAVDMLVLENISNVKSISILSITGQTIRSISNDSNMLNVDLSDLNSGVYIIKFNATEGVSAKSFIKQ